MLLHLVKIISSVCCLRIPVGPILVCHQVLLKRPKPSEGGDHQVRIKPNQTKPNHLREEITRLETKPNQTKPNHLRKEITRSESNQTKPNHLREEITRSETKPNQTKPSERGDHQVRIIAIITKCRLLNRAQDLPFIRHTFPGVTITE